MQHENFYLLTGGPGTGKTSLIHTLQHAGFKTVEEDARRIIKEQIAIGGNALPWANKELYAICMFNASLSSFKQMEQRNYIEPIFFDRGMLDAICYMRMESIPISEDIIRTLKRYTYRKKVFILPAWKEIYSQDNERKQSWEEAECTEVEMKRTYLEFGYEVIEVPKVAVSERCQFILNNLGLMLVYLNCSNPFIAKLYLF